MKIMQKSLWARRFFFNDFFLFLAKIEACGSFSNLNVTKFLMILKVLAGRLKRQKISCFMALLLTLLLLKRRGVISSVFFQTIQNSA
jgi:hypothetical protein